MSQPYYRWIALAVTTVTQTGTSFISQGVASLSPFFESSLGLTKAQVGLVSGAPNIGMAFTSIIAGKAVDIFSEKRVLVLGSILTGISILIVTLAQSFLLLFPLLLLTGMCSAAITPAGSKAIMAWFPIRQRGMAFSIRQTGVTLGGFLAALILPFFALRYGWQGAFVFASAEAVIISLFCLFLYKEERDGQPLRTTTGDTVKKFFPDEILQHRGIWLSSFASMIFVGGQFVLISYIQLFLRDQAEMSITFTPYFLALAHLAGAVGRIWWGVFSDRWFGGKRKPVLYLIGLMVTCMSISMIFVSPQTPVWLIVLMVAVFGISAVGWNGVWIALVSELAGKEHAGFAVGFGITVLQMGVLSIPPLFGLLVDLLHTYVYSWIFLGILTLGGVALIGLVKESQGN